MSYLRRILTRRVVSEARAARFAQLIYFAASPALLILAVRATTRLASTPGEVLLGVLSGVTVALLLILVGLVLPMSSKAEGGASESP